MASSNQSPEYQTAEKNYLAAQTDEQRMDALEEMIKHMPQHKGAENMRANLRQRYKKLKEKIDRGKKSGKSTQQIIKKEDMQAVIVGLTNSGKSSILNTLTNAQPLIGNYFYTTKEPQVGTMFYENSNIQIIDEPAIESEYFNQGIANTADLLIIIINNLDQLKEIGHFLKKARGKRIILYNKSDLLTSNEKRKIEATFKSKIKIPFIIFSSKDPKNLNELKELIFKQFDIIRIYTKEPGRPASGKPMILKSGKNTVEDAAKKVSNQLFKTLKETRVTGPSTKFPNQKVGLKHELKDRDIVEFHTR